MAWQPILDGELGERAWTALRRIANDLAAVTEPATDLALFWSYAATALGDRYAAAHTAAVTRLEAELERDIASLALFDGLAGRGFAVAHCSGDADAYLELVDQRVLAAIETHERWPGHYDLISGLVGYAVYFLERGAAPSARVGLAAIVDRLAAMSERDGELVTWRTPSSQQSASDRARYPDGRYDCGLAHGVPGAIAVLARIGAHEPAARELADRASRWLLAQRTADPARSRFPMIARGSSGAVRTAWCYGDAGATIALWSAAQRAGQPTDEIRALALAALSRSVADADVRDAMFCHGAAGLGHISNRMFHASGDERFRVCARRWFADALAFEQPHGGLGGFLQWRGTGQESADPWQSSPDILEGSAGIGLVLIAALTPMEPEWDRLLLCDLPIAT